MKLYATVTSERASKGQGGQKYLDISIRNEFELIGNIFLLADNSFELSLKEGIELTLKRPKRVELRSWEQLKKLTTKGKQKKGDCSYATEDTNFCETHQTEH